MKTVFSFVMLALSIIGTLGALKVFLECIKSPRIEVSEIGAHFSDPQVTGGTCFRSRTNIIPAIYGSVVVENKDGFFSDNLRSCSCTIEVQKGEETVVKGVGAWSEEGMRSLGKEKDIQKGSRKQLHVLRAIIEPQNLEVCHGYQEESASSFHMLRIDKDESPLFQTHLGKVWIEFPEIVEAEHGGWRAKREKPKEDGGYQVILEFIGEDFEKRESLRVDFKDWLKVNSNNWQADWQSNCPSTVNKAKKVIDSL